jgi:hypothetical protein
LLGRLILKSKKYRGLAGAVVPSTYAYASGKPLDFIGTQGLLDGPRNGGNGGAFGCPLVAEVNLGYLTEMAGGIGTLTSRVFLCIYDCNRKFPGSDENLYTEIQTSFPIFGKPGCFKMIEHPDGF